jgi:hypothetical protein
METLDAVQEAAFQVAEDAFSFADVFAGIANFVGFFHSLKPKPKAKKSTFTDILKKFL